MKKKKLLLKFVSHHTNKRNKAATMNIFQIKEKLRNLSIQNLAISTGFEKRSSRKIDATNFVSSFFQMLYRTQSFTYGALAALMADQLNEEQTISHQAVAKRFQFGREDFARAILEYSIAECATSQLRVVPPLFSAFSKVVLEDSTSISLPDNIAPFIPGFTHPNGTAKSTARIQLGLNLLNGNCEKVDILPYKNNDQSYAYESIKGLRKGDLLIRDLGYHVLGALQQMVDNGIYFLSRYQSKTNIRLSEHDQPLDLLAYLKANKKHKTLDLKIWLGEKRVPLRMVIQRLPPKVVLKKQRKARKHRSTKTKHDETYYELLAWNIYITNVSDKIWTVKQVQKAYACRWRIEIIFRCWKSRLKLDKIFSHKTQTHPATVWMVLYLSLAWINLFFMSAYAYYRVKVHQTYDLWISIEKFATYIKERTHILNQNISEQSIRKIAYYCKYEKRNRPHFYDLLYDK